jgi:hypothetical protein
VIKKSLLFALLLVLGYIMLFHIYPIKTIQDMQFGNIAKAQKFLYEGIPQNNLIIGSSISEKLIIDSLGDTQSLAFSGLSVFDGLCIIKQADYIPTVLFVEMNVMEKAENRNFTGYFTNPLLDITYKKLPSMRADARPVGYLIKLVNYLSKFLIKPEKKQIESTANTRKELVDNLLRNQQNEYNKINDSSQIRANFVELLRQIEYFEEKGCKIVFFEMPIDRSLRNLHKATFIRKLFMEYFPLNSYHYILQPEYNYESVDGIHLTEHSAIQYTMYLKQQIKNIYQK